MSNASSSAKPGPSSSARSGPAAVVVAAPQRLTAELMADRVSAEPDLAVIEVVCSQADFTAALSRHRPQVALVDIRLFDGDVGPACERVRTAGGNPRLCLVIGPAEDRTVMEAVEGGCSSFASVEEPVNDLLAAVRAAAAGVPHLNPDLVAGLVQRLDRTQRQSSDDLTSRELEVLGLLAKGLGNAAIADRLGVSVNTVRHHVQSILTKLGVHTKLQAVTSSIRAGLISAEGP
jgi:DNA-binding NarL/FixJ family response regulator